MCYASSCNPRCGDCRPKRIIDVNCPECGMGAEITRDEYLVIFDLPHRQSVTEKKLLERGPVQLEPCKACGADLRQAFDDAVQPLPCHSNRVICGFPCGRRNDPYREGVNRCVHMVPVGKYPTPPASSS